MGSLDLSRAPHFLPVAPENGMSHFPALVFDKGDFCNIRRVHLRVEPSEFGFRFRNQLTCRPSGRPSLQHIAFFHYREGSIGADLILPDTGFVNAIIDSCPLGGAAPAVLTAPVPIANARRFSRTRRRVEDGSLCSAR